MVSRHLRGTYACVPHRAAVFIGHALLAFAIAAVCANRFGWSSERSLAFGVLAGAFGALPDVDIVYAIATVDAGQLLIGADPTVFWAASEGVHRAMTHSIVIAAIAAPAFALLVSRAADSSTRSIYRSRLLGAATLGSLVVVATVVSGPVGALVMSAFVLAGAAIVMAARRRTDLSPRSIALAAFVGFASHPWGDLVTGEPPWLLYPFDAVFFGSRVMLHADPTLHLLAAFSIELVIIWAAILAFAHVSGWSLWTHSDPSASIGATYSLAAIVLVPPTLEVSYHFVFSILFIGVVCGAVSWLRSKRRWPRDRSLRSTRVAFSIRPTAPALTAVVTALAGTTIALVGYGAGYLAL